MTSTVRALLCATGLAVAAVGCSAPPPERSTQPERTATAEQPDRADVEPGLACTEIGNAEFVRVDLADVLDLEGGDYVAQVSLPATGARCDGENYLLNVLATTSGELVPQEVSPGERRRDARGREPMALSTACGLRQLDLGEQS